MRSTKVTGMALAVLVVLAGAPREGKAEVSELRVGRAVSIGFLPLMIMEQQRLVEKHAEAAGVRGLRVEYRAFTGGTLMNDALISGSLEIASGGVPPFLLLWNKTRGNIDVRGIGAFMTMPLYLNTRNPAVKSIKDFTSQDRINVLAVRSAFQAIVLQMAAAKTFGPEQYARLDPLTVGLPLPDALAAMVSGGGHITADFTVPPFSYQEREHPSIHTVLTSYEVTGGPHTYTLAYATRRFTEANPKVYGAFAAALKEAVDFARSNPKAAAAIYVEVSKQRAQAEAVSRMLGDPEIVFDLAPHRITRFADFMFDIGTLKGTRIESWKDLFFPGDIYSLPGS